MPAATLLQLTLVALALSSVVYALLATAKVAAFHRRLAHKTNEPRGEAVTVLKPLCGEDPELYENLCSFCLQDHDRFQILFGVREEDDPAVAVVHEVMARFPELDLKLVVDPQVHGGNFKVGNLINLYPFARHDIVLISDSDMRVTRHYLQRVTAPFADPAVGAATCLYRGRSLGGLPSNVLASYVNEWFYPSAVLAQSLGEMRYCFGATIAIRREVVSGFGGLETIENQLADDYMLGRLTVEQGRRVVLCDYVVDNIILEPSLRSAVLHELRWARTISRVRPLGFAASIITDTLPVCVLAATGLLLADAAGAAGVVLLLGAGARAALHRVAPRGATSPWWSIPAHDFLTFIVRVASFFGANLVWRGRHLRVDRDGTLLAPHAPATVPDLECEASAQPREP